MTPSRLARLRERGVRFGSPVMLAAMVVMIASNRAYAQCDPSVFGAIPDDSAPDDWGIQQCLDQGGTTVLAPGSTPGYIITNTSVIKMAGTTLQGNMGAPGRLIADPSLQGLMLVANNINNFTLAFLVFDGQKSIRSTASCGVNFDYGKNLRLVGNGWQLNNVTSRQAVCGSGAEVSGSGYTIVSSFFRDNGFPNIQNDGGGPWADGLTVWSCNGPSASIRDSFFLDNTDIDLVVGGGVAVNGSGCSITGNTISNTVVHAFAGLQLGNFSPGNGNHSGITYSNNTISSSFNLLSFGLIVGLHPWDVRDNINHVGVVSGNQVSGSVINLQIEASCSDPGCLA